jgi:hypothetical protein
MNLGLQYQKYLDWLEDRGQFWPSFARHQETPGPAGSPESCPERAAEGLKILMVHGSLRLDDSQTQLMLRIGAACGFDPAATSIQSVEMIETGYAGSNARAPEPPELIIAFGKVAMVACAHMAQRSGLDQNLVVEGDTLEALEASPAAKRDLWKKLQSHKGPLKTTS